MSAKVDDKKCTGCGKCVDICPVQAIKIEKGKAVISDECVDCGVCLSECELKALSIEGRQLCQEEMEQARQDQAEAEVWAREQGSVRDVIGAGQGEKG